MGGEGRGKPAVSEVIVLLRELEEIHRLEPACPAERREAFLRRKEDLLSRIEPEEARLSSGRLTRPCPPPAAEVDPTG